MYVYNYPSIIIIIISLLYVFGKADETLLWNPWCTGPAQDFGGAKGEQRKLPPPLSLSHTLKK